MSKDKNIVKNIDDKGLGYWNRRNRISYNKLEKDEAKLEKQLKIYYEQTAKKLDKEIAMYYAKYGEDNVLRYRAMLKSLSPYEAEMLIRDVELFTQAHPELRYLVGVRKSIYKLDRLEGLRVSIELEQMELAHKEKELIEKHLVDAYERVLSDMYKEFGYGLNFNTINRDVAKRFIGQKWVDGKSFSDSIYNNRSKVANHIMKDFTHSMIRGDSYKQAAKIFTDKFVEVSMRNAMRLIRTEGTHVLNEASISYWDKEGFEEYRYSAIWDDRTSQICIDLDGQVFKMKERQAGSNFPPMHPNCRSGYEPIVPKDWEDKLGKKYEEDVENAEKSGYNKNILIPMRLQLLGGRDLKKQNDKQILKGINSHKKQIKRHLDKISNPEKYIEGYDDLSDLYKEGLNNHWKKEIKVFKKNIKEALEELERRKKNDE